jgi:hypothetical protein
MDLPVLSASSLVSFFWLSAPLQSCHRTFVHRLRLPFDGPSLPQSRLLSPSSNDLGCHRDTPRLGWSNSLLGGTCLGCLAGRLFHQPARIEDCIAASRPVSLMHSVPERAGRHPRALSIRSPNLDTTQTRSTGSQCPILATCLPLNFSSHSRSQSSPRRASAYL